MKYHSIEEKDRAAIEKTEIDEFEARRLRGTGYDMMKHRDKGWGRIHEEQCGGKTVEIEWHVAEKNRYPYQVSMTQSGDKIEVFPAKIPKDKFILRIGKEEAVINTEAFRKLFRWV